MVTLVSANYRLPQTVGSVQIDCAITKGYGQHNSKSTEAQNPWGLDKDARLRLWPAGSPLPSGWGPNRPRRRRRRLWER